MERARSAGMLRTINFAVPLQFCFAVLCLAVISSAGFAQTSIDDTFQPTTPVETLTAPFTTTGATTANEYTDLVEINVSGFGQGAGTQVNDAFYVFESAPGNPVTPQPIWTLDPSMGVGSSFLRLSLSGCACSFECGAPSISEFMAFIDGIGPVSPRTIPAFNAEHTYRFVIDLGSSGGRLTLGNFDCGFSDNTGAFTIGVNGVEPVPPDRDNDGILDAEEPCICLQTPSNQVVTSQGCSIDQVCPCAAPLGRERWKNHDEYEQCVTGAADELMADGVLTRDQRKAILRQAKQSGCGRRF